MERQPKCRLFRVPVAFNELNPIEKRLLDHVKAQGNRSKYLKLLVERDMFTGGVPMAQVGDAQVHSEPEPRTMADLASQFMG